MRAWHALVWLLGGLILSSGLGFVAAQRGGSERRSRRTHQSLTENLACSACHSTEGWSLAVGTGGRGFDHAQTGFPLTGQHAAVACAQCHVDGQRTLRACVSCHQDTQHQGRLGRDCAQCHNAVSWRQTDAIAVHRNTRLPLTGMHVLADCTGCHRRTGERQWTDVPADCFACHARDYFDLGTHPLHSGHGGGEPFPRDCGLCHRPSSWSPAFASVSTVDGSRGAVTQIDHDLRFRISAGSHRGAPCESCHASASLPQRLRCADGCHAHRLAAITSQHARPVSLRAEACLSCHPGGAVP
ncbi:MAG: hypothetical protein KC668_19255 [Myxococcales bacterium]|nr:hypothetical protein [Myxococcales bacterium]